MISCRIVLNELPDDVFEQMLCIDEIDPDDTRWRLLNRSNSSETYHFAPRPGSKSWFVRWGHHYSLQHFKESLLGRDEATLDWRNTSEVARLGIPVTRYRLLASPRLITGSLDTLLAREFLKDASNVGSFMIHNIENKLAIEDTLIALGDLLGMIHERGMQHGRFALDHILIQYNDPSRLAVTDWHEMRAVFPEDALAFREDLVTLLNELAHIGLAEGRLRMLLESYALRMAWCRDEFAQILAYALPEPAQV